MASNGHFPDIPAALPSWYHCGPPTLCASSSAPGGLTPEQTPQFVLFTHDDAVDATSNKVVRAVTDRAHNANGCGVPATWFTIKTGTSCDLTKKLWQDGHEIAAHTLNHKALRVPFDGGAAAMETEMLGVRSWLNNTCGIPLSDIVGFRSPFLVHNPSTRAILYKNGMLYDSSIIESWPSATSPGKDAKLWPYDMADGIPQASGGSGRRALLRCGRSGTPLFSMDPGGDAYSVLKTNFDFSYNSNKAPFGIFIHAPWLTTDHIAAMNKFVDYALAKGDVWFNPVPKDKMAAWLQCGAAAPAAPAACVKYTIKAGDSLFSISQATGATTQARGGRRARSGAGRPGGRQGAGASSPGTRARGAALNCGPVFSSLQDILSANPSLGSGTNLVVGSQLKVPPYPASCDGGASSPAGASPAGSPPPSPTPLPAPAVGAACQTYAIGAGDTLASVVDKYRVTLAALLEVNPSLTETSLLSVGQQVKIPPYPAGCVGGQLPAPAAAPAASPAAAPLAPLPKSGLRATFILTGMSQTAFLSEGLASFQQILAHLLDVDASAIASSTYALPATTTTAAVPSRRRLAQAEAAAAPLLGLDANISSAEPLALYSVAAAALAPGGALDQQTAAFGVSQAAPPVLTPYDASGAAIGVSTAASPAPAAAPAGASMGGAGGSSSSPLSTGAIVGIAVGGAAAAAAAAAGVVAALVVRRRRAAARQAAGSPARQAAAGMVLLDNGKFLTELHRLFESHKDKGTVFVTMKRTNLKPRRGKNDYSEHPYVCLVRATDGKRKLSTSVAGKDVARFHDSYTTIMRAHMDTLRKRERTRHNKQQQAAATTARRRSGRRAAAHAAAGGNGSAARPPSPSAIEASRSLAALRAAHCGDAFAAALAGPAPAPSAVPTALYIATRFIDAQLLECVNHINFERKSSSVRETNQVVLLGNGFDTRPFRLPWPEGTVIYLAAPGEVHEVAERQLAAAAAASPGAPWLARVPRGCLLRRVAADPSLPGALEAALEAAGLRGDRLSVWGWQLAGCGGAYASDPAALLGAVASMAALESLVVGELSVSLSLGPAGVSNLLAGYGLLGAAVDHADAAAALASADAAAGGERRAGEAGAGGGGGEAPPEEARAGEAAPLLFLARQKRLSVAEMDAWAAHGAAQGEAEESDGILPFS
eukprot:scaffold19.g1824.t1